MLLVCTECNTNIRQVDIEDEVSAGPNTYILPSASDMTPRPTDCAEPSLPTHQYICGVCQSVFHCRWRLTIHKRRAGHVWFKCDVCGRHALNPTAHVCRRADIPTVCHQKFKCGFCRRSFACWDFLMKHLRSHSSGHVQIDHSYSRPTDRCKQCTCTPGRRARRYPKRHSRRPSWRTSRREKREQPDQDTTGSREAFPSDGEFKPGGEFPSDGTLPSCGAFPPDVKFKLISQSSENPG